MPARQLFSDAGPEFLADNTDEGERVVAPTPTLTDQQFAAMLKDDSVLAFKGSTRLETLSAFEQHVAQFVDGRRPVARIRKKSGLSADDLRIALGMMADGGHLVQLGVAKRRSRSPQPAVEPAVEARPPEPAIDPALLRRKLRARELFQTAQKEFETRHPARGFLFAKMAATQDPEEPAYRALVEQWAHLDDPPAKKTSEPEWTRLLAEAQEAEDAGKKTEALGLLQRALKSRPDQPAIHNRLGILLARQKIYDRAAEHLMRAVELDGERPAYRNNLAKVLGLAAADGMDDQVKTVIAKLTKRRF